MDRYKGEERRQEPPIRGWHVDRTVSVTHIFTTVMLLVSGLWFVAQQQEQISLNKQMIGQNRQMIEQQEGRVTKRLDVIDSKLDKLLMMGR